MFKHINLKLLLATTLTLTLIKLDFPLVEKLVTHSDTTSQASWVNIGSQAEARKSGGRSSGGSFSKSSSKSSSGSKSTSTNSSKSSSTPSHSSSRTKSYRHGSHVEIEIENDNDDYIPAGSTSNSAGVMAFFNVILLLIMALIIFAVIYSIFKSIASTPKAQSQRDNNIVTLTKLQVALLAQAATVQSELSELILRVDPNTNEGLWELLQESVLVLLRQEQYWSHALASSNSLKIDQAQQAFNKLSLSERSKLSAETLTNINGKIGQRAINVAQDESAAYIIVTFLIGTTDDRPLFKNIHSIEELKHALEKLSTMRADNLMKLELIWSPQDETESLSYDEFITVRFVG